MRPGLPLYLGRRWRSKQGDKLILERWTLRAGRRAVHFDDCPECVEGIEVGHGAGVAECLNLARYLVRAECGQMGEAYHAARFADDIVAQLPNNMNWSIDACTIRDYVNGEGRVLAHYNNQDIWLPAPAQQPQLELAVAHMRPDTTPITAAMDQVLDTIDGNDF